MASTVKLAGGSAAILRGLAEGASEAGVALADLPAAAPLFQNAERTALDERASPAERAAAARMLAYGGFAAAERALPRLLDPKVPPELRMAAIRALSGRRELAVAPLLLEAWGTLDADARREALAWFSHPQRYVSLLDAIEQGTVARDAISADLRKSLVASGELGRRARVLLPDEGEADRRAVVERYRAAVTAKGEAARGREVFRAHCATCHRLNGEGHEVGPNLATVRAKSKEALLEAILDPNRLVEPEFLNYKVLTVDGRFLDGLLAAVTPSSLTLRRAQGETETVLRSNVESLMSTGFSPMPEGLEKSIDAARMADLLAYLGELAGPAETPTFRAGAAKVRITPDEPGWLLCYDRHQKAEGVEAELWLRALAFEDAQHKRTVMVCAEILGFPPSLARSIREEAKRRFNLDDGQLLLSASHTHNGPVLPEAPSLEVYHNFTPEEARPVHEYAKVLRERVMKSIEDALARLRPARISWARGRATFATNRRLRINPDGHSDPDVLVLAIDGQDGAPLATVFGYACHGTTIQADTCFKYHGDYAGVTAAELERRRPGVTAMYLAGCGGDINPQPLGTLVLVQTHGRELADAVTASFDRLRPLTGPLQVWYREIELPLLPPPTREALDKLLASKNANQRRHAKEMLARLEKGPLAKAVPYPILTWRFGQDLTLVALSGETCVDYSLRLKRELDPQRTWIAGYANEVACYIPSEHVLAEGGYEAGWDPELGRDVASRSLLVYAWPAPLAPGVEDRIVSAVHDLLKQPPR